ncbi:hypothetical protein KTR10_01375 [Candidatus Kaiserbacteria bacterium]|nr:hypothetical protein [Candidatus Kaiserbacteria bacterium]
MAPLRLHKLNAAFIVRVLGVVVLGGALLWYGIFQARFFLAGPVISLESPTLTLQADRTVTIAGTAQNITEIRLNGKEINTDAEGAFAESLVLPTGYTIMTLRAKDRYGRTVSLTKELIYQPTS